MKNYTIEMRKHICAMLAAVIVMGMTGPAVYADAPGVPPQVAGEVTDGADQSVPPETSEEAADPDAALTPPATEEEMVGTEWEETLLQTGEMSEDDAVDQAQAETEEEAETEEISDISEDPLYAKMNAPMAIASIPASFGEVTPRALKSGEALRKGIDVSAWQETINWPAVKAAGIEFAIIRLAYRGVEKGGLALDNYFASNLKNAKAAGLKVGAYIFSQAVTPEEAREEARYLVNAVKGYSIDLPLVFDYEEVTSSDRRLKMDNLSRQYKVDICKAFCAEVESLGYRSMVYSNPYTINNHLDRNQIQRLWLAHFSYKSDYTGAYEYWQFGLGAVSGISGQVDLDYWFEPNGLVTPPLEQQQQTTETPEPTATPKVDTPPLSSSPFSDVQTTSWYAKSVLWAYDKHIVSGVGNGSFAPNNTATRGQMAAMLYRLADSPSVSGSAPFTDLKEDYYKDAVNWASSKEIVNGTGANTFNPNGSITREDLVTMLYRMADSPAASGDLSGFTDQSSVHSYAQDAMIWAVGNGLIKGYSDKTILPRASASRAEVCEMLMRFDDLT